MDQLNAYSVNADPLYYTMKFVDGLRSDIKKVIMVQCPFNLEAACSLALVQEEARDSQSCKHVKSVEPSFNRNGFCGPYPLPAPPKTPNAASLPKNEDKRGTE